MKGSSNRATKLALLIGSCVLAVGLLELAAALVYRPALDLSGVESPGEVAYTPRNGAGFREDPVPPEAFDEHTTRVLVLGDSFTFGQGVPDANDRFTERIEARLNAEAAAAGSDRRFHLYNAGAPGSFPSDWLVYLEKLLPRYRPNVVVAVFFLRDGTSLSTSLRYYQDKIDELRSEVDGRLAYRFSYVGRTLLEQGLEQRFSDWYLDQFRRAYLGNDEETKSWVTMRNRLRLIDRACQEAGVEFQLVIFPLLFGLRDYRFYDVEEKIADFARGDGIPVLSLIEGFAGRDERALWVGPHDQHPNEAGHAVAAETLYPYLARTLGLAQKGE